MRILKPVILFMVIGLCVSLLPAGCSSNGLGGTPQANDTIKVATVKMKDTTTFAKSNGDVCAIYADAAFSYPTSYSDNASLKQLQKLYMSLILDAGDTLSLNDAMHRCVSNTMHQYDLAQNEEAEGESMPYDESEPVLAYHTSTTIQLHYNKNMLVTFCRVDVVKKDSQVTSVTHNYYTIDLKTMTRVGLDRLVRDDAISQVTAMLRSRLLEQNKVENNDQLNELGYYNIDNLIATQNFYFDANGVTWSYLPNKLAVSAIGEPKVTLTLDELKPLACEGSILERIN